MYVPSVGDFVYTNIDSWVYYITKNFDDGSFRIVDICKDAKDICKYKPFITNLNDHHHRCLSWDSTIYDDKTFKNHDIKYTFISHYKRCAKYA